MLTAEQILDHEYLEARCMLLELAAILDRYDRASGGDSGHGTADPRVELLYESLSVLSARNAAPNRAERLLNLFSDPA